MEGKDKTMLAARLYSPITTKISDFNLGELNEKIKIERVPIPRPRNGEVLIKVEKCAINPMDLSTLKGTYGTKPTQASNEPSQLGHEGCGTVISSGGGILSWRLQGKRVAFFSKCTAWAEYVAVPAVKCIDIGATPWEQATSVFVNPMTVMAFIEVATAGGNKTILHTVGASALGKMLIRYGKRVGIEVISIVRKPEAEKVCRDLGCKYVLNSTDQEFHNKLKEVCVQTKCKLAFDAVGGELTATVLNAMLDGAEIYVYGGLSEQPVSNISVRDLIFKNKCVKGFWLTEYIKSKYTVGLLQWTWTVVPLLTSDFSSDISSEVKLENLQEGLLQYAKNMAGGKVLVNCNITETK